MGMLSSQPKRRWADACDNDDDQDGMLAVDGIENEAPRSTFELDEHDWPATQPMAVDSGATMGHGIIKPSSTSSRPTQTQTTSTTARGQAPARDVLSNRDASSSRDDVNTRDTAPRPEPTTTKATPRSSKSSLPLVRTVPAMGRPGPVVASHSRASTSSFTQPRARPPAPITANSHVAPVFATKAQSTSSGSHTSTPSTHVVHAPRPMGSTTSARAALSSGSGTSVSRASSSSSVFTAPPKKRVFPWELATPKTLKAPRTGSSTFQTLPAASSSSSSSSVRLLAGTSMDIQQKVVLSSEQQMVHKLVVDSGKSVFFTGSAGTGKSVLLREIISSLKRKHRGAQDAVAVTASTGMAACNIGGTTIHSFAGIGIGTETAEQLIGKVQKNKNARGRWQRVKVLVIDEVSMVDGILFDKLAAIGSALKKTGRARPFGGIQIVVTGDFFQLPPVAKGVATFAFEAKAWSDCIEHTVNLTQVFRQRDTRFIDMLNEMRFGKLSAESISMFKSLSRDPKYTDGIDPTELYPRREEVERSNVSRLSALPGELVEFRSEDWPSETSFGGVNNFRNSGSGASGGAARTILNSFMAPEKLSLKVGAQVMLIKNLDATFVNGTIGKVIGFGYPELDALDEFDAEEDSKVKIEMERRKAKIAADVAQGKAELAPRVEWRIPGGTTEIQLLKKEEFKVEDVKGQKVASRKQYPIILAWAMSIHKSQGQTLPRVKVDLNKVFEKGQSYVALSRATCLEGLQVLGFTESKVAAHEKVSKWSKSLEVLS